MDVTATDFSATVTGFWQRPFAGDTLVESAHMKVVVNPDLTFERRVTFLARPGAPLQVTLTPAVADTLALDAMAALTEQALRARLADRGIVMHEPDLLFNFTQRGAEAVRAEPVGAHVRRLTAADQEMFTAFEAANSAADLDVAWVSLTDWAVFGAVVDGELVCVSSAYPWGTGEVADIGILTSLPARGQGHGVAVVRAISAHIYRAGLEPQYRTQPGNEGSRRTALRAGLASFGIWETVTPEAS